MREYIYANEEIYMNRAYYEEESIEYLADSFSMREFSLLDFELIEEDTIDIDRIEEVEDLFEKHYADIDDKLCIQQNRRLINKLIRCIKQLNKEIKELNKKYCCNCGVELTEENTALPNMCNECKYGEE